MIDNDVKTTWLVWCPEDGETIEEAREIIETGADDAATKFVEDRYHKGGEHFDEMTVRVQEMVGAAPNLVLPTVMEFCIHVDFSVDFRASNPKVIS